MIVYIGKVKGTRKSEQYYEFGIEPEEWEQSVHGFIAPIGEFACSPKLFEEFTGLKLAPGEIKKVKSIKIEVE